jgi:hypothetical protein
MARRDFDNGFSHAVERDAFATAKTARVWRALTQWIT